MTPYLFYIRWQRVLPDREHHRAGETAERMNMNRDELLQFHETLCSEARELMQAKNHDYAGPDGQTPFANFDVAEKIGICSAAEGMLVRMTDKLRRLITFAKAGQLRVKDETVQDTCRDLVNYAILFAAKAKEAP